MVTTFLTLHSSKMLIEHSTMQWRRRGANLTDSTITRQ